MKNVRHVHHDTLSSVARCRGMGVAAYPRLLESRVFCKRTTAVSFKDFGIKQADRM